MSTELDNEVKNLASATNSLTDQAKSLVQEIEGKMAKFREQDDGNKDKVEQYIANIEQWKNNASYTPVHKFILDLSALDANTMYPVYFRFGNGPCNQNHFSEVNIGRYYAWNRRNPSPFSDNSSTTHIAGLDFRIVGSDNPWGGGGWHGIAVEMYDISYMNTVQLFESHRMICYSQPLHDETFTSDNSVKPTQASPVYSGLYLRGGLLYKGTAIGMGINPILVTTPKRLYNNSPYNRSEWIAPFPYTTSNNSPGVNNYGK